MSGTVRAPARWIVCVALLAAALALGGLLGALLVLATMMIALDILLPVPHQLWAEADGRFARAARRRRGPQLELVDDGTGRIAAAERRELGVQSIPIDSITGTTEATKARLFDRAFRPDRSCASRWKSLWMAEARGLALPPVSVYRVDGRYVLRDGHHRVSVARDHGRTEIEADVVELRPPSG